MQQEVDVAIVMKAMKIAYSNQLQVLVLLAGDGDFKDMVEFLTETLYKKVWVLAYKSSLSASLQEKCSVDSVLYLDDIWEHISAADIKASVVDPKRYIEKTILAPDVQPAHHNPQLNLS